MVADRATDAGLAPDEIGSDELVAPVVRLAPPVRPTGATARALRLLYVFLRAADRPLSALARRGFANFVILEAPGRRTGDRRVIPLGLLRVGERWYLGHATGDAPWTLNLRAAGGAGDRPDPARLWNRHLGTYDILAAVDLVHGPERDAVIRAAFRQHMFPANLLYRLAGRHVREHGTFFRIDVAPGAPADMPAPGA